MAIEITSDVLEMLWRNVGHRVLTKKRASCYGYVMRGS